MSHWAYANAGVPQGSVFRIIVFLIYRLVLVIRIVMFVDNITLICQLENLQDLYKRFTRQKSQNHMGA